MKPHILRYQIKQAFFQFDKINQGERGQDAI